jgi:hypothetical protein
VRIPPHTANRGGSTIFAAADSSIEVTRLDFDRKGAL